MSSSFAGALRHRRIVIVTQVYVPDPAAVGQQMADLAEELVRRGFSVSVITSDRGYDDPTLRYATREQIGGVSVRRLPRSWFGKASLLHRIAGSLSFMAQAFVTLVLTRRLGGVLFSTTPPMVGVIATLAALLRRAPRFYWAMDLNPDQMITLGRISAQSMTARVLEVMNRFVLRNATLVIALDRFMEARLVLKGAHPDRIRIIPPWAHQDVLEGLDNSGAGFRDVHGLNGALVVMYSGNHTHTNPLDTLLDAALLLRDDARVRFVFVGGGSAKSDVEHFIAEHELTNAICLPYQPLASLGACLSAADIHVVTLGNGLTGILHPCKVYGAMAVGRPILYIGPGPSHVTDLLASGRVGWHMEHGSKTQLAALLLDLSAQDPGEVRAAGMDGRRIILDRFSQDYLRGKLVDEIESWYAPAYRDTASRT